MFLSDIIIERNVNYGFIVLCYFFFYQDFPQLPYHTSSLIPDSSTGSLNRGLSFESEHAFSCNATRVYL